MFNLSLMRPFYLGALAFTAIPILIHLLHRRKIKVLPFPFVRFLIQSYKRRQRFLRIHNILLLLVRIAVLCLLGSTSAADTLTEGGWKDAKKAA